MQFNLDFKTGAMLLGIFGILVVTCTYGLLIMVKGVDWLRGRSNRREVVVANQPIEVKKAPKRFSHDVWDQRCVGIEEDVADHEQRIADLENTTAEMKVEAEKNKNEILQNGEAREIRITGKIDSARLETKEDFKESRKKLDEVLVALNAKNRSQS